MMKHFNILYNQLTQYLQLLFFILIKKFILLIMGRVRYKSNSDRGYKASNKLIKNEI